MKEVHVSNVPYSATEQDLKTFLETVTKPGAVYLCELKRDSFRTDHKGFGFVTFVDDDVAESVRRLSNFQLMLHGRILRINVSTRKITHNPEHSTRRLEGNSLSIGCVTDDTFHALWSTTQLVQIEIDFRDRKLHMRLKDSRTSYKLEFPFKYTHLIQLAKLGGRIGGLSSESPRTLLLEVYYPPHIYRESSPAEFALEDLFGLLDLVQSQKQQPWVRTVDFTPDRSIGQSFSYLLEFCASVTNSELSKVLGNMEDFKLASADVRQLRLKVATSFADSSRQVLVPLVRCPENFSLPFKVMFKLNGLVQQGHLSWLSLTPNLFRLLSNTPEEHALWLLEKIWNMGYHNPEQWLQKELLKIKRGTVRVPPSTFIKLQDGLIWTHRLMVSPTKIFCVGPEAEMSNRVTRQYMDVIDNFIRVSFIEEDGTNLSSQALLSSEDNMGQSDVYKRVLNVLKDGIWVMDKHYEFLAFSSSQLREHSVWMFAPVGNLTTVSIRRWMGNFLAIRNVAKCAAGMGQCFSSTTKTLAVDPSEVNTNIEDIRTQDGKYTFSDGIGKISVAFAKRVAAKCGHHSSVPSAFQIRYGGYKGVVAVDPESLEKLSLRPSMRKFQSEHFDLEVISWSKCLPCFLNRQVITLLATLGIDDRVFERLQGLVVSKLNEVVTNAVVALDVLQLTSSGATHQTTIEMLKAGFRPTAEPYLRSLLQAFRAFQLLQLRTKSRILVAKGRTLMGCLDETGTLGYGQVFVKVSSFPGSRSSLNDGLIYDAGTCVLRGPVMVAKNPCLHPGDVRVLQAVYVPQLCHMVDCVVFPQRGHRPHPNECSGSDLDGDLYFVTWDESLIPRSVAAPMDYVPPEPLLRPHPVLIQDIQKFFADYMKSDALGVIANAHLVHSDKEPLMARDSKCLILAELFSIAVDFPKTGKPAVMHPTLRATTYPDFMEKDDKYTYVSQRALGKLFRSVVGESKSRTLISTFTRNEIISSFDKELVWPGFESYINEAEMLKSWYDGKLVALMNQYGIKTEAEALSGNILPLTKFYVKRQGDVKDRISMAVRSLQSEARRWFKGVYEAEKVHDWTNEEEDHHERASQYSGSNALEEHEAFAKASAWYHVTYNSKYLVDPEYRIGYLLSFPWVLYDTLLTIKSRNRRQYN